jgi:hypothetical protein
MVEMPSFVVTGVVREEKAAAMGSCIVYRILVLS